MKTPHKWIRIKQGDTVLVYRFEIGNWCSNVEVIHRPLRPALFRKASGRRFRCI